MPKYLCLYYIFNTSTYIRLIPVDHITFYLFFIKTEDDFYPRKNFKMKRYLHFLKKNGEELAFISCIIVFKGQYSILVGYIKHIKLYYTYRKDVAFIDIYYYSDPLYMSYIFLLRCIPPFTII